MLQRLTKRHEHLVKLLLTVALVAFGWLYLPSATVGLSVVRSGGSVEPVSLYIDHSGLIESPTGAVTPSARADLDNPDPAVSGVAAEHRPVSGHHRPSGHPTSKKPDRRQALVALAALLIQIQSAGTGGR